MIIVIVVVIALSLMDQPAKADFIYFINYEI